MSKATFQKILNSFQNRIGVKAFHGVTFSKHKEMTLPFLKKTFKRCLFIATIGFQFFVSSVKAQSSDKAHLGIIYPISTHGSHAPQDTNSFSFHLLGGVSAAEKGLAFAGLTNVVKHNTEGIAFAGFSNHVGEKASGLLFAGFTNTYQRAEGMQFAGFANLASSTIEGAQFAGFLNTAANLKGIQMAGFSNIAKNVTGTQFAGFLNTAKEVKGPQFAGFANIASGNVKGEQMSGFSNVARDVEGTQIAGFINVARKVKGAQIAGFINIADSSDCPIGIINLIKNGEKSISATVDESETTLLSFRSGGKIFYGIIGLGYNWKNEDEVYAFEAGLGAHVVRTKHFRLNTELASVCLENFEQGEYFKTSFRLMPAISLGKTFELLGGPSFNFVSTSSSEGKLLHNHYFWESKGKYNNNFNAFHIGYTAGINIKF